jgi:hypothetical protein
LAAEYLWVLPRSANGANALIAKRHRVFVWAGAIVATSWLTLAFLNPDSGGGMREVIGIAYFVGSLFAHATLAAAWSAFGPAGLAWRIPLSVCWLLSLTGAMVINFSMHGGPDEIVWLLGLLLLGQWMVLQPVLWGLKAAFQLHLQHADDQEALDRQNWQFGIRQLMIVTAFVGVVFGIGRILVASVPTDLSPSSGEHVVFSFLCVSAIIFSLPLLLAALMQHGAVLGVPIVLALIAVGTYFEEPLLQSVAGQVRPNIYDMIAINVFTSALILAVAVTVRLSGYSLTRFKKVTADA